jgi:thiamine-phosphate pyrophosphorylase
VNVRVGFKLYLITDRKLAARHGGLLPICEAALRAAREAASPGAIAIQLREKDLPARELYELACALRKLCARFRAPLIVNDRIDIAIASGADGVHLPADSFAIADARRLLGRSRLIGISTHEIGEVGAAYGAGADFAVFGPVYAPRSKAGGYAPPRGIAALRAACHAAGPNAAGPSAAAAMPVFALGGITAARARALAAGARADGGAGGEIAGVGVIGVVFGADDPAQAVKSILAALSAKR